MRAPMRTSCLRPPLPTHASSTYNGSAASATVALTASVAANSPVSATINPHTPPQSQVDSSARTDEPVQPRYMTRSVVQNAARRKQKEQNTSQLSEAAFPAPAAFTFTHASHHDVADMATASGQPNPYSMLAYGQQAPWMSSALYQATRAVAAATTADSANVAEKQPKAQAPAAKRRKNAAVAAPKAAATTQRAGRGRATQRTKQQQVSICICLST
ncbi:hypothetical protein J3F80_001689 [Coemansia sp. RSA 2526]|nr:hypothetical protein J3F80_001689 [Coemansia sp. RSA 2526]